MKELFDIVKNLDANDIMEVWNKVCEDNSYDDFIFDMYDFEDINGDSFRDIFPKLMPDFDLSDDYFWYYNGNIYSGDADAAVKSQVDWSIITNYIEENIDSLDFDDDDFQEYKEQCEGEYYIFLDSLKK